MTGIYKNLRKDFLVEYRNRSAVNISFAFAIITTMSVSLVAGGTGFEPHIHAILIWIIIFFSGMNGLAHTFIREEDEKNALFLRLSYQPEEIFVSKLIFNIIFFTGIIALICPLYLFFLQTKPAKPLLFILTAFSGGLAIASITTILGAMVSKAGGKGSLFTVLSFPLILPVMWVSISNTWIAIEGNKGADYRNVLFLILFSGIIALISYLLFRYIWVE
jgi:heme exporter protein B